MRYAALLILLMTSLAAADVKLVRVPEGGIEPQAAVDAKGTIHLIYYKGPDDKGDLFYVTSSDGGETFTAPVRVNSQAGSALAVGGVRGAQMALGRDERVHVTWMGSSIATPKAPGNGTPMLYARSADDGKSFEPQKNVISAQPGMDGGGSIAADDKGHVYIAWHAPLAKGAGEESRRVWLAKSTDDGKTFAAEFSTAIGRQEIGACACCSIRIAIGPGGEVFGVYRKAEKMVNRGTMFFTTDPAVTKTVAAEEIAPMTFAACLMSNFSLASTSDAWLTAYETSGEVFLQKIGRKDGKTIATASAGKGKYPSMAVSGSGEVLVARAVGMGWKKSGTLAWQVFDKAGEPIEKEAGEAKDVPVWSYPAAVAKADGSFVIFY